MIVEVEVINRAESFKISFNDRTIETGAIMLLPPKIAPDWKEVREAFFEARAVYEFHDAVMIVVDLP